MLDFSIFLLIPNIVICTINQTINQLFPWGRTTEKSEDVIIVNFIFSPALIKKMCIQSSSGKGQMMSSLMAKKEAAPSGTASDNKCFI